MRFAQGNQVADVVKKSEVRFLQFPIHLIDGIRRVVRIVAAAFRAREFLPALDEGHALGSEEREVAELHRFFAELLARARHGRF